MYICVCVIMMILGWVWIYERREMLESIYAPFSVSKLRIVYCETRRRISGCVGCAEGSTRGLRASGGGWRASTFTQYHGTGWGWGPTGTTNPGACELQHPPSPRRRSPLPSGPSRWPPLRYSGGGRDEIAEPFLGFRFFAISLFLKFFYSSRVLALYRVPYRTRWVAPS